MRHKRPSPGEPQASSATWQLLHQQPSRWQTANAEPILINPSLLIWGCPCGQQLKQQRRRYFASSISNHPLPSASGTTNLVQHALAAASACCDASLSFAASACSGTAEHNKIEFTKNTSEATGRTRTCHKALAAANSSCKAWETSLFASAWAWRFPLPAASLPLAPPQKFRSQLQEPPQMRLNICQVPTQQGNSRPLSCSLHETGADQDKSANGASPEPH